MNKLSISELSRRLNRKIARRQLAARWGKLLLLPTIVIAWYLGRRSEWFMIGGIVLVLLEGVALMQGETLRCPLCDASLVVGRGPQEEFAGTCPECGYAID